MVFEELKMIRTVYACSIVDEVKLAFCVLRCNLDHINRNIDIVVNSGSAKYKLVDLESLFIISPRYEAQIWQYFTPRKQIGTSSCSERE